MTKLSAAFGDTISLRIKTFELGNHTFKVRIPLSNEMDAINQRTDVIDNDKFIARYKKAIDGIQPSEGIEFTTDDVVIEGRSTAELVKSAMKVENRIVEYIKLLVTEVGNLEDITYEDIDAEWPFSVQVEILTKIGEAIQPGYKESRKN
jgi:hypothetical protein